MADGISLIGERTMQTIVKSNTPRIAKGTVEEHMVSDGTIVLVSLSSHFITVKSSRNQILWADNWDRVPALKGLQGSDRALKACQIAMSKLDF